MKIAHLLNVGSRKAMGLLSFSEIIEEGYDPIKMEQYFKEQPDYITHVAKKGDLIFNGRVEDNGVLFVGYRPALQRIISENTHLLDNSSIISSNNPSLQLFHTLVSQPLFPQLTSKEIYSIVTKAYCHGEKWINILEEESILAQHPTKLHS